MLQANDLMKCKKSVILHESLQLKPYVDTMGIVTIGVGYNLTDRGLSNEWAMNQLQEDIQYFYNQLDNSFKWFAGLNADRQICLVDMCFMGFKRFCGFVKMIAALEKGDYQEASAEMLASDWAKEVKGRSQQLADGILHGIYNP